MKTFIVEFQLKSGSKRKMVDLFELQGPNRSPGVTFCNAWIGTQEDLVFVLCEAAEEGLVAASCQAWSEFGESRIHPVIHHEQY